MKFLANNIETFFGESGQQKITLALTAKQDISDLKAVIANGKLLAVDISQQRKKRSLDANSYAWAMITQIADVLRTNKEELYIEMLKRYGQREKQLVSVIAEGADIIYRATNNHCCEVGESELNGKTFKHLAILIGSSQYNSKQFSIFLDGVISEAKELNIETLDNKEIKRMVEEWGKKV